MEQIKNSLTAIGLSEKETFVYLTLLKHGTTSTSFIAKKAKLNRGTTYLALHSLLEKGLLTKSVKNKVQYFTAQDPKHLIDYLDRKEEELKSSRENVQGLLGQLSKLRNPNTTKPRIKFFEGIDGTRRAIDDTLTSKEEILRSYLNIAEIAETLGGEYFEQYTNQRIENSLQLRCIRDKESDKVAVKSNTYAKKYKTSKKENREVRHLDDELGFPVSMYIYDNKVNMISSKEENFAVIIESKEICEMQKKLFDALWRGCE